MIPGVVDLKSATFCCRRCGSYASVVGDHAVFSRASGFVLYNQRIVALSPFDRAVLELTALCPVSSSSSRAACFTTWWREMTPEELATVTALPMSAWGPHVDGWLSRSQHSSNEAGFVEVEQRVLTADGRAFGRTGELLNLMPDDTLQVSLSLAPDTAIRFDHVPSEHACSEVGVLTRYEIRPEGDCRNPRHWRVMAVEGRRHA